MIKPAIIILAILILVLRFSFAYREINGEKDSPLAPRGEIAQVTGLITSFPERTSGFKRFTVKTASKKIVTVESKEDLGEYGEIVELNGKLLPPKRKYPVTIGYFKNPKIKVISQNRGNYLLAKLFALKKILIGMLDSLYPQPASSFLEGILFGYRSSIPNELILDFRKTGLSHIIALSGYNVVILIAFVSAFLSFLPRRFFGITCIAFIIVFVLFVGGGASVARAAFMGCMSVLSKIFGRKYSAKRVLALAGSIMTFFDPLIILYDVGFQLSFAATAGILLFSEKWREKLEFLPNVFGIKDSLVTTFASQVFTLPIIMFYFKGVSLIAPLANIVVLPFIPVLMLGGFLSLFLGKIVAAPTWIVFNILVKIIAVLGSFSFSYMDLPL